MFLPAIAQQYCFKMGPFLHAACMCLFRLQIHQDLREELAKVKTLEGLADVSKQLRLRCQVQTGNILSNMHN